MTKEIKQVKVETDLSLGQLLKLEAVVPTGGQAKHLVASGRVRVNGVVEKRRGRKLGHGDVVEVNGRQFCVSRERV